MVPEPFQQVAAVCGVLWCPMVLLAVWQNTNWPRLTPILLRCHGRPHAPALRGCRSPRHSRVCELISQPIESCAYFKCSDYFFLWQDGDKESFKPFSESPWRTANSKGFLGTEGTAALPAFVSAQFPGCACSLSRCCSDTSLFCQALRLKDPESKHELFMRTTQN